MTAVMTYLSFFYQQWKCRINTIILIVYYATGNLTVSLLNRLAFLRECFTYLALHSYLHGL